jgi:chromate transporter
MGAFLGKPAASPLGRIAEYQSASVPGESVQRLQTADELLLASREAMGRHSSEGQTTSSAAAAPHPTLADAVITWLKIGVLSFGGPAGQIALMHRIVVEEKRWIDEARFLHALNYCMLLPGPEAQQLAVYLGWLLHRMIGGLVAGILFVLPGVIVMMTLSILYVRYREVALIEGLFWGIRAAVLAIVVDAVVRIGRRALRNRLMYTVAALAFIGIFFFDMAFPLVVLAAAVVGFFGVHGWPAAFSGPPGDGSTGIQTPAGAAAIGSARRGSALPWATLACGLLLWFGPTLALAVVFGWSSSFVDIAVFFSKMAVVTFGGAYAVLSYVAQQAVETYGWLSPGEMLTGLGLAETTPGPLILVVQHVAFLGAYRAPQGLDALTAGILGGLLATWVTFVPCFLWIFLGAPYVERLRGNRRLSAALAAITAAVVGVILNLAVWFAVHVIFADVGEVWIGPLRLVLPYPSTIDLLALAVAVLAVVAMLWVKAGILPTIAGAGALGIALRLW